jgi:hypothetical protein
MMWKANTVEKMGFTAPGWYGVMSPAFNIRGVERS